MFLQYSMQQVQKRGTDSKVPRFFVFIAFGFCLSASSLYAKKQSKVVSDHRLLAIRQSEAQMVDLPLPVGGVLVPALSKDDAALSRGLILTYRVTATREALVRFYEEEMMRLGWNKLAKSSGDEELLVFESPSKMAIVQMRPEKPKKGWKRNRKIILTLHETSKEN